MRDPDMHYDEMNIDSLPLDHWARVDVSALQQLDALPSVSLLRRARNGTVERVQLEVRALQSNILINYNPQAWAPAPRGASPALLRLLLCLPKSKSKCYPSYRVFKVYKAGLAPRGAGAHAWRLYYLLIYLILK